MKNKTHERRKVAGLCIRCGLRPVNGKLHCDSCSEKQKVRDKEDYIKRQASRICIQCSAPVFGTSSRCEICREYCADKSKRRTTERKAAGLCINCINGIAVPGNVLCEKCAKVSRNLSVKRTAKLDKNNICNCCGKNETIKGKKLCTVCYRVRYEWLKADAIRRVKNNLCTRCSKPARENKTTCKNCQDKQVKRTNRRYANDSIFRLSKSLRSGFRSVLRGKTKVGSAVRDLGCTLEELWIRLESMFKEGMTRENYGEVWEVDHIRPFASFDLEDREQLLQAVHYSNLQPMFKKENRSKGSLYNGVRVNYAETKRRFKNE